MRDFAGVSGLTIASPRAAELVAFYETVLGFLFKLDGNHAWRCQVGATLLTLRSLDEAAPARPPIALAFRVDSLQPFRERLERAGIVPVTGAPADHWCLGEYHEWIAFKDLAGNAITLEALSEHCADEGGNPDVAELLQRFPAAEVRRLVDELDSRALANAQLYCEFMWEFTRAKPLEIPFEDVRRLALRVFGVRRSTTREGSNR